MSTSQYTPGGVKTAARSEAEFQKLSQTIATSIQKILQNGKESLIQCCCPDFQSNSISFQYQRCNVWSVRLALPKIRLITNSNCEYTQFKSITISPTNFSSLPQTSIAYIHAKDIERHRRHANRFGAFQ